MNRRERESDYDINQAAFESQYTHYDLYMHNNKKNTANLLQLLLSLVGKRLGIYSFKLENIECCAFYTPFIISSLSWKLEKLRHFFV
jgi:hypothetical protein